MPNVKTEVILDTPDHTILKQWMHGPDEPALIVVYDTSEHSAYQRVRVYTEDSEPLSDGLQPKRYGSEPPARLTSVPS